MKADEPLSLKMNLRFLVGMILFVQAAAFLLLLITVEFPVLPALDTRGLIFYGFWLDFVLGLTLLVMLAYFRSEARSQQVLEDGSS